jgi:AbrB family looped-hinge helix DNA binding protein
MWDLRFTFDQAPETLETFARSGNRLRGEGEGVVHLETANGRELDATLPSGTRGRLDVGRVRQHLTCMRTKVSTKGQVILPAEIRELDGIEPGQQFDVERIERGQYRLVRQEPRPNEGLVDWLLSCPEKGFFVPIASESTDTL